MNISDKNAQTLQWFVDNIKALKLKVTHLEWTKDYLPEYTDICVNIQINHTIYYGRGTDTNADIAFIKASVEAVERAVLGHHQEISNSNGIAGHSTKEGAIRNAKLELIERDRFLGHFLAKKKFYNSLEVIVKHKFFRFKQAIQKLQTQKVQIHFQEMTRAEGIYSTICIATGKSAKFPFGMTTGLGAAFSIDAALEASFLQCVRKVIAIMTGQSLQAMSINNFMNKSKYSPEDHMSLACDLDYGKEVLPYMLGSNNTIQYDQIDFDKIECYKLNIKNNKQLTTVHSAPLVFYKATSNLLQDLYFGETTKNKVNLKRISTYSGKELDFIDIQKIPHPMG
ncbi:MAG: YcaO-like family protein [Bacteriovoracaceae bacterium]|nr:YcaO-like family protein [Bacteriovoracaceae bacterium]